MTYYIGLDLGQLQDYTARAVVRVADPPPPPPPDGSLFYPADGGPPRLLTEQRSTWDDARAAVAVAPPPQALAAAPFLQLRSLHRWPLKTKYGKIAAEMKSFMSRMPQDERCHLIIDGTGVGVSVLEQFDAAGVTYEAVSIHGGLTTRRDGKLWRVPKKALVSALQVAGQNKRLQLETPSMPFATELRAEIGNFRHTITAAANDTYAAWRERDHDDLVLALAIAVWKATLTHQRAWAV